MQLYHRFRRSLGTSSTTGSGKLHHQDPCDGGGEARVAGGDGLVAVVGLPPPTDAKGMGRRAAHQVDVGGTQLAGVSWEGTQLAGEPYWGTVCEEIRGSTPFIPPRW